MRFHINKKVVGLRIKQIRLNKGYTLEAFGKLFNTSKSNVLRWEQGLALPNKGRLADICKISDITVNELLYGTTDEFIENNIDNFILESDYPYPYTFKDYTLSFTFSNDNITLLNHVKNSIKNENVSINDLENISRIFKQDIELFSQDIISMISSNISILESSKELVCIFLINTDLYSLFEKENFDSNIELIENTNNYITSKDNFFIEKLFQEQGNYTARKNLYAELFFNIFNGNDKKLKIKYYNVFSLVLSAFVKITELENNIYRTKVLYTTIEKFIYNLSTINKFAYYEIPYINTYFEYESYFIENRFNLETYEEIIALHFVKDKTLYYLANYLDYNVIPINTEVDYFILNHDNTYQITKITEKPDCKYLAPILGKLE